MYEVKTRHVVEARWLRVLCQFVTCLASDRISKARKEESPDRMSGRSSPLKPNTLVGIFPNLQPAYLTGYYFARQNVFLKLLCSTGIPHDTVADRQACTGLDKFPNLSSFLYSDRGTFSYSSPAARGPLITVQVLALLPTAISSETSTTAKKE